MIGCLIGEVLALEAPTVLLNVNGVGYEIDTPLTTFCQLQKGQKITLWTHLAVREDAQLLYGFINAQEKTIFRTLLKVNGVGKKTAERLMIELRDRFKAMASGAAPSNSTAPQIQFMSNSAVAEAEAALQSLGYKPAEAQKLVNAAKGEFTEASDIIRAALKSMNK